MRSFWLLFTLLTLVTCGNARDASFDPGMFAGDWVVRDVFCRDCGKRHSIEIGAEIHIDPSFVVNPLGGDCRASPGFGAFRPVIWREVSDRVGIRPEQAHSIADARQQVMEGSITCAGIAYFPVIAINDGMALYPFDGGLTFLLTRPTSTARPGIHPRTRSSL